MKIVTSFLEKIKAKARNNKIRHGQPNQNHVQKASFAHKVAWNKIDSFAIAENDLKKKREVSTVASYETIERNPKYRELVRKRGMLSWTLSAMMLLIYMGFILLVSFAPDLLSTRIGTGVTTVGIVVGLLVIISAFILTGFYVMRANAEFDTLTREIVEEAK